MTTMLTRNDPVVFHFRIGKGKDMEPKTGATVVFLPEQQRFGLAMCCEKDRYSRKLGRKIATARARVHRTRRHGCRFHFDFDASGYYYEPLEMTAIRDIALGMVYQASEATGNPVGMVHGPGTDSESIDWSMCH